MIVPITGHLSWRKPPLITIALILINCAVFLVFQPNDQKHMEAAWRHYLDSGLARIELEYHLRYQGQDPSVLRIAEEQDDEEALAAYLEQMLGDKIFQRKLEQGDIVGPNDPDYHEWKMLRQDFEARLARVSSSPWGFKPAQWRPLTLLTSLFLHGGIGHLLGNMLFLWLFGCMLEPGMGRLRFLGLYLISGVGGDLFFALFNLHSRMPLIGASGAIAGLMGALPVLYGRRKVNFFCYFGFYFNYIKIPAIALLPFWLGMEIWSEISRGDMSSVAFMAHAGGIISGASIAWLLKRRNWLSDPEAFRTPPPDEIRPLMERAMQRLGELEFDRARDLFMEILEKDPDHGPAIMQLYNLSKQQPASPAFHQSAARYLNYLVHRPQRWDQVPGVYEEYLRMAGTPRLPIDIYPSLAGVLADKGHPESAARIISAVIKKQPLRQGLPTALLKLSAAFRKKGMARRADQCLRLLLKRYPESPEARSAGLADR
ncbi:MAG: rhomboid family intramembrane serine protease [Desulfosarcina sp.]|nr:rhomboid family intramembrane serine protease [Desulfobacterales bacterium]